MGTRTGSTRREGAWGRRQWGHVALSVLGLVMVVGCAWVVVGPQYRIIELRRGIGAWICNRIDPPPMGFFCGGPEPGDMEDACLVLKRDGEFSDPRWSEKQQWILGLPEALARGERAWLVGIRQSHRDSGVWAGTRRRMSATLKDFEAVGPYDEDWDYAPPETREESDGLRTAAMNALWGSALESVRRGRDGLIADGSWAGAFPLWSGYMVNAATIVGLGIFLWFTPVVVMDVVRWRRMRRGGCATCGYDLRGLPDRAMVCPECGAELVRTAGDVSPAPPR